MMHGGNKEEFGLAGDVKEFSHNIPVFAIMCHTNVESLVLNAFPESLDPLFRHSNGPR